MADKRNLGAALNRIIDEVQRRKEDPNYAEKAERLREEWGEEYDRLNHPDSFVRRLAQAHLRNG